MLKKKFYLYFLFIISKLFIKFNIIKFNESKKI